MKRALLSKKEGTYEFRNQKGHAQALGAQCYARPCIYIYIYSLK